MYATKPPPKHYHAEMIAINEICSILTDANNALNFPKNCGYFLEQRTFMKKYRIVKVLPHKTIVVVDGASPREILKMIEGVMMSYL